jgi:hypothetical protein
VGSTPRFAPGSKAKPVEMEVDNTDEVSEVIAPEEEGSSKHTPLRGINPVKRKAGQLFSGSSQEKTKKK